MQHNQTSFHWLCATYTRLIISLMHIGFPPQASDRQVHAPIPAKHQ